MRNYDKQERDAYREGRERGRKEEREIWLAACEALLPDLKREQLLDLVAELKKD